MVTNVEERATVDLILAEKDRLLNVARRLTRCEADAEDLVQDTMLRAYRARDRFEPGTSIRAWTTTILRRVFLTDVVRAGRRGVETDTDLEGPLSRAPGRPGGTREEEYEYRQVSERLDDSFKRALDRVPEIYRTPFWLATVDDLSCAEIASRLRIPAGTAMSRIHRARERLKADLANADVVRRPSLRVLKGRTARATRAKAPAPVVASSVAV